MYTAGQKKNKKKKKTFYVSCGYVSARGAWRNALRWTTSEISYKQGDL